jgi:RNA 2',3'-cyclic 3'-phosphodiesterase
MRLFVALDIDGDIRGRIARFLEGVRGFAPEARWVRAESLHVTLKFIGEKLEDEAEEIKRALETITAGRFEMNLRGYGFFPGAQAPRVVWIGVEADPKLALLANAVDKCLAALKIQEEEHAFSPHLTLARDAGGRRPARKKEGNGHPLGLRYLQEKLAALPTPEFGRMTAREFFLFQSQPLPGGSKYTKLARFPLQ